MATAALDAGYLAAAYAVPETTLQALLAAPTPALVHALLGPLEAKARAFDDLQAEKLKADVELANAVHRGEQRARSLQAAADAALQQAAALQTTLAHQATARQQLEAQLHAVHTATAAADAHAAVLESRIRALEAQNRDTLATYETKAAAHDRLAQELADQHRKYVDLRKTLAARDEHTQALESAANTAKFRETSLQHEMELLRKNAAWYEAELQTRTADHTKFRKEKNAHVAELQRANADAAETIDALQRTEALLRKHVDELRAKADDDHARIQQLQDDAANTEANFRGELESLNRLAAMHKKAADMAKTRLDEVAAELARLEESAAEEVGQLQAEIELERSRATEAEATIANLESMVENLEREAAQLKHSTHAPATPRRSANGAFGTPARPGSPAVFSPRGTPLKGLTNTKILAENATLKEQLRDVRDDNEQKTAMIQSMVDELERLDPAVEELRRANDTLTSQITDMASDLEAAVADKDTARREERKARGDLEGVQRDRAQLEIHVQDLTVQLRSLMWRQQASEQGLAALTPEQQQFIISTEGNELPENERYGNTATDLVISQHLVLYKNISDLQKQNAELLRTIREVAQQHEGAEARSQEAQVKKDQEELVTLRSRVAELEDQVKSLQVRAQSYKKERDMYRQVATSRNIALPPDADGASNFGQSSNSQAPMIPLRGAGTSLFNDQTLRAGDINGVDKLVKTLQTQVDTLKEESATDRANLKSQVERLTKDNSQLQSEKMRLDSQVRREQDHYARLESSVKMLEAEKNTLQERYHSIQTTLAKQDDKVVRAEQEAVDAIARLEGVEHELVNLKASQSMWQTIEARLTERNQELMDERDRLSKMVTDVQSLRNEQELANAENRRRLQDRIDALEGELHIAQRKLDDATTEHKKASLQREYERSEAHKRVEDLMKARNEAEVRCASADAARQQLEQRVGELRTQLQSAEERVQALQPVPTSQAAGAQDAEEPTREEELIAQAADLQRKLGRKQEDLEAATAQIEGFQNIAQEAEEALQNAIQARDDLQVELDRVQEEKDAIIADLQRRVDDISSEFTTTNTELTELRGQHEQETMRLNQEKEALDAEITNLKNDVNDYKAEAERQTQYVKSQAEIATRARQDYEHELAKHGETMHSLRALREEYNGIKSEITQFKTQAEAARTALEQSEESWKATQTRFENQLAETKRNYDDLKQHNRTLLEQFDNYKAQINDLKSNRTAATSEPSGEAATSSSKMEDITTFLKQEKDILEAQLSVKDSEAKRLNTELAHVQSQLDQTREKLHAEQSRARGSLGGTNLQALQNQIEQLNVFRESNTTLRNDAARLETRLAEKNQELESLQKQLDPLKARVEELEGELELTAGYLEQEKKQRDYWEKRFDKFVNKSEHIDPKELEDLKKTIEDIKAERDQYLEQVNGLNKSAAGLQEKIQTLEGGVEAAVKAANETQKEELRGKFNKRHKQLMEAAMETKKSEIDALTSERDTLRTTLTTVQQELETSRQRAVDAQQQATKTQEQLVVMQQQVTQLEAQTAVVQQELNAARANSGTSTSADVTMGDEGQANYSNKQVSTQQLADLEKKLEEMKVQLAEAQNRAFSAENDCSSLKVKESFMRDQVTKLEKDDAEKANRIVELQEQLISAQAQASKSIAVGTTNAETTDLPSSKEIDTLKEQLVQAHQALQDARADTEALATAAPATQSDADMKEITAQGDVDKAPLKTELEERENKLQEAETALGQREIKVATREGKVAEIQKKAQDRINSIRSESNDKIAAITKEKTDEIERLKKEIVELKAELDRLKSAQSQPSNTSTATIVYKNLLDEETADSNKATQPIDTESLARPTVTASELKIWINNNQAARSVIIEQIKKHIDPLKEQVKTKEAELAKLNEQVKELASKQVQTIKPEPEQTQTSSQAVEMVLAKAKAEHQQALEKALKMAEMKHNAKIGMAQIGRDKWNALEKIAKETPAMEVSKAVVAAVEETKKPKTQASSVAGLPLPATGPNQPAAQQAAGSGNNVPQANGVNASSRSQPATTVPNVQTPATNPFLPAQSGRGIAPPGFAGQNPFAAQQPQPQPHPQPQIQPQQQQQGGRGRGDGMGTGPRTIQGLFGTQTSIPRGGASSIPLPGGRGRGGQPHHQQPQTQQNQPQAPNNGGQAAPVLQIGRGGSRGNRGGGRGGAQSNQSPRTSLNPGAAQFSPQSQPGMGRGQKRGAEDEGEGGTRGGKRARGRGGQGGAGVPQAE
ncbi:Protein mlp1 [Pleosporales sp. CAS-2024a]